MPHIPDSHHAGHDPLAIAAFAAGDATGPELDAARAMVADCEACAALHHDLRAIAAALPVLPAPVRSRDFRLSPEQAASLRPAGWRRLLAPLAGPRFAFAGPLGTGLATLGIAGFLVAGSLGAPLAPATPQEQGGAGANAPAQAPVASDEQVLKGAAVSPAASLPAIGLSVDASADPALEFQATGPMAGPVESEPPAAGGRTPGGDALADPGFGAALPVASAVALVAGLLLAGLRVAGRRIVRQA